MFERNMDKKFTYKFMNRMPNRACKCKCNLFISYFIFNFQTKWKYDQTNQNSFHGSEGAFLLVLFDYIFQCITFHTYIIKDIWFNNNIIFSHILCMPYYYHYHC